MVSARTSATAMAVDAPDGPAAGATARPTALWRARLGRAARVAWLLWVVVVYGRYWLGYLR